jgi:aconitate hydratase
MINGLGVVGWGVGGIEAEASMLGQPIYLLTPDVVAVNLTGQLREGVTATDLVLTITEFLRKEKVVGKFVEFIGDGAAKLSLTDRATISNMAPEYGATIGFFPIDQACVDYLEGTGKTQEEIDAFVAYYQAQRMFGMPSPKDIDYSKVIHLDLLSIAPSLAGPKRPQDRIEIGHVKETFSKLFSQPIAENGFNKAKENLDQEYLSKNQIKLHHGDILIAAITSCTNTSNPSVMLAAGLLAKKAVEAGLTIAPHIKTSLAPGSRVVTEYLKAAKLLPYLEKLGFSVTAYGCTTCIGNSGDLNPDLIETINQHDVISTAILSGNRNFEARIHPNVRANFLASPPLVIAYAIAGNVTIDLMTQPLANIKGRDIYLGDIWPSSKEIANLMKFAMNPETFTQNYAKIKTAPGTLWQKIPNSESKEIYNWPSSTYIAKPPFFDDFEMTAPAQHSSITGARALGIFGDSITTDHISPAGSFNANSPAGQWLLAQGVQKEDFNSYGSRRGNHEIMIRGTFANVRIKNLMLPSDETGARKEGGYTLHQPSGTLMSIFDAAMAYIAEKTPTVIFAGDEYGTGSSRDWAAKGTYLLGVKAVIARSYERIHRSNLIGMGVLPLQFLPDQNVDSLNIKGDETFDILGLEQLQPQQKVTLVIHRTNGEAENIPVLLRIDTPIEVTYYQHGGILPFVLRQLLSLN